MLEHHLTAVLSKRRPVRSIYVGHYLPMSVGFARIRPPGDTESHHRRSIGTANAWSGACFAYGARRLPFAVCLPPRNKTERRGPLCPRARALRVSSLRRYGVGGCRAVFLSALRSAGETRQRWEWSPLGVLGGDRWRPLVTDGTNAGDRWRPMATNVMVTDGNQCRWPMETDDDQCNGDRWRPMVTNDNQVHRRW